MATAGMAGTMSALTDIGMGAKIVAGKWNPAVALYDPVVKYGSKAIGQGDLGEKFTISKWIEGTANVYAAYAEAFWYRDSEALTRVHAQNMSAANGVVLQGYAQLGDAFSKSGVIERTVDGVDAVSQFVKSVPGHFKKAAAWWEAL